MEWMRRWNASSLAVQFVIAGGSVALIAMVAVGLFVAHLIEDAVTHNSAATTALYVDSVIAPLLPDMRSSAVLDETTARALDETLDQGALGQRLMSFRLWRSDGTVLYSNEKQIVGKRFPPNPKLLTAFGGTMVSKFQRATDPESKLEQAAGKPLLEIYNPVLQPWSGQVVAVLEFYEVADGLQQSLEDARLKSWIAVAGFTIVFFLLLSAIVFRGSRIIDEQRGSLRERVEDLSDLLVQNDKLHQRVQKASQRAVAMNESHLRKIGADLHDGPAQLVAYASLRLDSDVLISPATTIERRQDEIDIIRASLTDAMSELRSISSGLVLPQIENASVPEIVERAIRAHEDRTETFVRRSLTDTELTLAASGKICVLRFVQEALNNAYRHSEGRGQQVEIGGTPNRLSLTVKDEGDGFDPDLIGPENLGLAGLRDRVESLGGSFDVTTSSSGTIVRMTLDAMEVETA